MGCSNSRLLPTPNNPLQLQQYLEAKREQRRRKLEKEQRKIAKLQRKHLKKHGKKKTTTNQRASDAKRRSNTPRISNFNYQTMRFEINKDVYDRNLENKLKNQLEGDLCLFITNQIALTQQFFGHFESEISAVGAEILAKENEINQNLEEHSILLANPLDVAIERWLLYQPMHGPDKHHPKPLQTQTMYVVFENIDIARPNDANYDSITPICKVDMEIDYYRTTPTKEDFVEMLRENKWKGYVRLKLRENAKTRPVYGEQDIYTDGSSGYSTTSHASKFNTPTAQKVEKENDYAYITNLYSHQPLSSLCLSNPRDKLQLNERVLPESCISCLGQFVEPWNEEDTDDERDEEEDEVSTSNDEGNESDDETLSECKYKAQRPEYQTIEALKQYRLEQERRRQLLQQRYLNSKDFMRYFGELMRHKLRKQLQLPSKELQNGTYVGASIHTKHYHIVPAIHVAYNAQNWPDCAFQFKRRERPISTNPHTGEQSQWPTRAMIQRIESFGFHVIPMGFAPKRQRNPFRQLEWRIVFPKAERFLEHHLSSTQIKVFMMCKALIKSFVEPLEKENHSLMFTIDYLRTHLFWECEQNYTSWSDEFLGEVLLSFLKSFMVRLREKRLKDFFIEERNLFENVPDFSLLRLNQILSDIIANPLMHLLVAFRNLRLAEDFFPKLNYNKLFNNLVENDLLKLRALAKNSRKNLVGATYTDDVDASLFMPDVGSQGLVVGRKEHREKTKGKLRRRTQVLRHNIEVKKQQELEKKRMSIESIDVEFFFSKNLGASPVKNINQGVENLRRTNILEIILDQLVATADKATQLRSVHLAQVELNQAQRLCKLYQSYGCDMGAKEYQENIQSVENEIDVLRRMDSNIPPPALPVRTSVEPLHTAKNKVKDDQELATNEHNTTLQRAKHMAEESQVGKLKKSLNGAEQKSPVEPKKYIKFTEHVVEVHKSDTSPIRKSEGYSPVSILRNIGPKDTKRRVRACVGFEESSDEEEITQLSSPQLERKQASTQAANSNKLEANNNLTQKLDVYDDIAESSELSEDDSQEVTSNLEQIVEEAFEPAEDVNVSLTEKNVKINTSADKSLHKSSASSEIKKTFGSAVGILKNSSIANSKPITMIAVSTEKLLNSKLLDAKRTQMCAMLKKKTISLKGVFNQSTDT